MTDKQINLLKNLDKNKIFNGDTIQFNFIEKTVKGVCFNQSIYIPIEDFEYFLQQLKRKEQECEELKNENRKNANKRTSLKKKQLRITQLKVENSILKDEYKILEDNLDSRTRDFEDVIDKYTQTLTEIKEICKTNVCKHCHSKLKVDDNYCKNIKECDCYKILQKISEVEDEKIH